MKHVLFICGKARMRSPTAANIVASWPGFATDFAGLSKDADEQISSEHIEWADIIAVMERRQKTRLGTMFGAYLADKRVVVLNIPDRFDYMEPALIDRLTPVLERVLLA